MKDVFIIGAGFSKAVSDSMPLLADLGRSVLRNLEPRDLPDEVARNPMLSDDLEHLMTYLSQSHPWLSEAENQYNRGRFLKVSEAIRGILDGCIEQIVRYECRECPGWLLSLIEWWHKNKTNVFTLNYDDLIERSAAEAFDTNERHGLSIYPITLVTGAQRIGSMGSDFHQLFAPKLKLFKLHGSINWFYSGKSITYGEPLYLVPAYAWNDWEKYSGTKSYHWPGIVDKVPLIVPPVTEKASFFEHETIRGLRALAAQALREAERIFCLGYSLPQTDVTMRFFLTINAPKYPATVFPVNCGEGIVPHFERMLGSLYAIDEAYAIPGDYRVIERFTSDLLSDRL